MAGLAARVFAAAEFLYDELRTVRRAKHFGRDTSPFKRRLAELDTLIGAEGEHAIKRHRLTPAHVAIIDVQLFALGDFILMAAVENDCPSRPASRAWV